MNKFLRSFKKDILNHAIDKYGKERADEIWAKTEKIYDRFLSAIPYIKIAFVKVLCLKKRRYFAIIKM